ncbi:MAG TPA: FecR domain-containing protein [Parasegetibacter sp.]
MNQLTRTEIEELINKYLAEEISREEFFLLWETLANEKEREVWKEIIDHFMEKGEPELLQLHDSEPGQIILQQILEKKNGVETENGATDRKESRGDVKPLRRMRWYRFSAAAAILAVIAGFFLFHYFSGDSAVPHNQLADDQPILPASEVAVLTLADGTTVVLDSMNNGVIATDNFKKVILDNGQIRYQGTGSEPIGADAYNTLRTPKGRQFRLLLPDSSLVWLNAETAIHYPLHFNGDKRMVKVTGEAFFEVVHNPQKPFVVEFELPGSDNSGQVEVLGTSFNINCYENEGRVQTTLVSGSVKIHPDRAQTAISSTLRPGEQATVLPDASTRIVKVDTEPVTAWKQGYFNFEEVTLGEALRQLQRWYNIEVIYQKETNFQLFGSLSRTTPLGNIVEAFQKSGINLQLEGRKLIVK